MRMFITDDDPNIRYGLSVHMRKEGFDTVGCTDGTEALSVLSRQTVPTLALLDWVLPGLDGPEVCRALRDMPLPFQPYIIILTVKTGVEDIAAALDAGADDYMVKPFAMTELRARVSVGRRVAELRENMWGRLRELESARSLVDDLTELLPVSTHCSRASADGKCQHMADSILSKHVNFSFPQGGCGDCIAQSEVGGK